MGWMACPLCGAKVSDQVTVCGACGRRFQSQKAIDRALATRPRRRLSSLGGSLVFIYIATLLVSVGWGQSLPEAAFVIWTLLVALIVLVNVTARTRDTARRKRLGVVTDAVTTLSLPLAGATGVLMATTDTIADIRTGTTGLTLVLGGLLWAAAVFLATRAVARDDFGRDDMPVRPQGPKAPKRPKPRYLGSKSLDR